MSAAATTIAPAYREVDQLTGTVASLRCQCAELEAERDDLANLLLTEQERNAELADELARLQARIDTGWGAVQ